MLSVQNPHLLKKSPKSELLDIPGYSPKLDVVKPALILQLDHQPSAASLAIHAISDG
jgi:hypothetical protein